MHCLETNLKQIIKDQHCLKMPSLVRAKAGNIQYIQYTLLGHHIKQKELSISSLRHSHSFSFFSQKKESGERRWS